MTIDELKRYLQQHLSDGLVTLVGSGLSAAAGLPTMGQLADHLVKNMPGRVPDAVKTEWEAIALKLSGGTGLEAALKVTSPESELISPIVDLTAELISPAEQRVIEEVLQGKRALPLSALLRHITFSNERHIIITTNYDRLVEVSAEVAGYAVDTFFDGRNYGKFDPKASKESLGVVKATHTRTNIKIVYRRHIAVLKPHGSLDWYGHASLPVRCAIPIQAQRLMIIPGGSKYRRGYDAPFDQHRQEANTAIDKAARYLVIGYGFNDDHLETHLRQQLQTGKPCVILAKGITDSIRSLAQNLQQVMVVSAREAGTELGTQVNYKNAEYFYPDIKLWDLAAFIKEVLQA